MALTSATTEPQLRAKDFPNYQDPDPAPWMIRTAAAAPGVPRLAWPGLASLSRAELTEPSPLRGSQVSTPTETLRAHAVLRPASRARTHADRPGLPSLERTPQGAQHLPAARSRPCALRRPALSAPLPRVPGRRTPVGQR